MSSFKDITGMKFSRLTAIKKHGTDIGGKALWLCKCECGNSAIVIGTRLRTGGTQSCGCLHKEAMKKAYAEKYKFKNTKLTQAELKRQLHYDLETGKFTRIKAIVHCVNYGDVAGNLCTNGYVNISVNGKLYSAHRLAMLYINGEFPKNVVDHINGIRDDNRWCNLRQATLSNNTLNSKRSSNNTSGYKGVTWHKQHGKWMAQASILGKRAFLGLYDDPKKASEAYLKFAKENHGEFYRPDNAIETIPLYDLKGE